MRYQSLERDQYDRSYAPPHHPEDDYYRREPPPLFLGELQSQNSDLQRELGNLKKELELTNQKLGSSMHSIKTFWSPELKKERALRKEESAKYSLINDQLKLLNQENQKQAMLVRQLEEELRLRMRQPAPELQSQLEQLFAENEHLQREIAILRDTIKELELRIETQKQTLQARDESIKKLLEMLQNKGMGKEEERQMFQQMQAMAQKQVEELKARLDEKSRQLEKKTAAAMTAAHELAEFRDHSEIKDRKINVLQRKLDLHEANKKLQQAGAQNAKAGEDTVQAKRQIQEEFKKLEDARRQFEEQRRAFENKRKDVEEKEKSLAELDRQLKKRKEQMDQMEASLRKAGGSTAAVTDMNRKLTETQKEADQVKTQLDQAKEEAKRLTTETERLLQLVQMSQEEQAQKEKQIMDLTQSVRNLQAKLKSQQQAQAQKEEEISRARLSEMAAIDDLTRTLAEKDHLKTRLEETKMKVIDLEIELNESSLILSELLKLSEANELSHIKRSKSFFELQKSGKVVDRLDKCRYSRSDNELDVMHYRKDPPNINKLTRKISELTKEIEIKNSKIIEQQRCISILEDALRENNNIAEFEQLLAVVRSKDERINELEQIVNKKCVTTTDYKDKRILELEEALKESFMIAAEREKVFYQEEQRRIETLHKMKKLEHRIRSLQNASALKCETCSAALKRLKRVEELLTDCQGKRDNVLRQLSGVIQDILEGAISEKDSLIAELEVKGVLDENETARCDALKGEKDRLLNRLKSENERIVDMERAVAAPSSPPREGTLPVDLTLTDGLLAVADDNEEDIPATVL